MPAEWERDAVLQALTEQITAGEFAGEYDRLTAAIEAESVLSERERQQLMQYWLAKERESQRRADPDDGGADE